MSRSDKIVNCLIQFNKDQSKKILIVNAIINTFQPFFVIYSIMKCMTLGFMFGISLINIILILYIHIRSFEHIKWTIYKRGSGSKHKGQFTKRKYNDTLILKDVSIWLIRVFWICFISNKPHYNRSQDSIN